MKFLSLGGLSIAGANLLSGCETATDANTTNQDISGAAAITRDAADFEAAAIQTYVAAAGTGLLTNQTIIDTALSFKSHHDLHLIECNKLLVSFDQDEVDISSASPDPRVFNATNQDDILSLALEIEFGAATFYFSKIVNEVQNTTVRKAFANILPIEVAHTVTYKSVLNRLPAINGGIFEQLTIG